MRAADIPWHVAEDLVLGWFVYILLCTQRMVLGAVCVNPGFGALRLAVTVTVLVLCLVATKQNYTKVGLWHEGTVTAVVCV